MKKYIYLKDNVNSVFFKYVKKVNIGQFFLFSSKSIIYRMFRKFNLLYLILGTWKYKVKDYEYFILGENDYYPFISKYIKKKNPNCKIFLFYWNIIYGNEKYISTLKDNNIDEFWTFDKGDSKEYSMKYNTQFYTNELKLKENKIEKDAVFLGRLKDRKDEILKLENIMKKQGLKTNFIIIENEKDFISYDKYLELLSKTKCILDYNSKRQVGLSLRPLEALFFEKKLITNNKNIKYYDFYNSNNIFILGEDNLADIKEFINKPYQKISKDIINYYSIENWINRFFE